MKAQLNQHEMEFIADLCEVLTNKDCIAQHLTTYQDDENGDVRYTEEAQDIFNEYYDIYETMYVNIVKTVPSITMQQLKIFEYVEQTFDEVQKRAEELLNYGNSREKMQGVGMLEAIAHIKQTLDSPISSIL
jgi:hypothetical protein